MHARGVLTVKRDQTEEMVVKTAQWLIQGNKPEQRCPKIWISVWNLIWKSEFKLKIVFPTSTERHDDDEGRKHSKSCKTGCSTSPAETSWPRLIVCLTFDPLTQTGRYKHSCMTEAHAGPCTKTKKQVEGHLSVFFLIWDGCGDSVGVGPSVLLVGAKSS